MSEESSQVEFCRSLFEEMAPKLVLYGRAMGLGANESEDIVQELFVKLLERESPPDKPVNYCLRAFRNRALNYRKSLWRRLTRELESIRWFERDESRADPRELIAMRCLETLPPEQREVIVLKIWQGLTLREIGDLLGLSPNTVGGRYRYGLNKLRRAMDGLKGDADEWDRATVAVLGTASGIE